MQPEPKKPHQAQASISTSWRARFLQYLTRDRVCQLLRKIGAIVGSVFSLLYALALWDSYRPKITITPSGTINSKQAFDTMFIVQNESALEIRNFSFEAAWMDGGPEETRRHFRYIDRDVTVIKELKPLETHSLRCDFGENQDTRDYVTLWFTVHYQPRFFGVRKEVFFFWAIKDHDGDYQWFPSGHHDSWRAAIVRTNQPSPVPYLIPHGAEYDIP